LFGPAAPQVCPLAQVPQATVPPQPSPMKPQLAPSVVQVFGLQLPLPQLFGVPPPPQVIGAVQTPQLMVLPQPSEIGPQLAPTDWQERG
jgi:hypothetical protein